MKRCLALFAVLLLVSFSTSVQYSDSAYGQLLKEKCKAANSTYVEAEGTVFLNGESVERINCSRLEDYSFRSVAYRDTGFGIGEEISKRDIAFKVLTPAVLMFFLAGVTSFRYGISLRRSLVYGLSALGSFVLGFIGFAAAEDLLGGYPFIVQLSPLLISIPLVPAVILYKRSGQAEVRREALLPLLVSLGLTWSVVSLLFLSYGWI